jgi:hypothetical protein
LAGASIESSFEGASSDDAAMLRPDVPDRRSSSIFIPIRDALVVEENIVYGVFMDYA